MAAGKEIKKREKYLGRRNVNLYKLRGGLKEKRSCRISHASVKKKKKKAIPVR